MKNFKHVLSWAFLCLALQGMAQKIDGVWYHSDTSAFDMHYFELHVVDSTLWVANDVQPSYLATYDHEGDSLKLFIKDINNFGNTLHSMRYNTYLNGDTLILENERDAEQSSTWIKIENAIPYNYFNEKGFEEFVASFRNRYRKNYLEIYEPDNITEQLKDFDVYWRPVH